MRTEWYYLHDGRIHGPVGLTELRAAYLLGFLGLQDPVCRRQLSDWRPAASVPILRDLVANPSTGIPDPSRSPPEPGSGP